MYLSFLRIEIQLPYAICNMLQKMQYILVRQKLQLSMHFKVLFRNPEIRNDRFGFVCFERKGSNM